MSKIVSAAICAVLLAGSSAHAAGEAAQRLNSTLEDQRSVAITIYNSNLGLVREQRELKLPAGSSELRFMDVATGIIPASVHIRSVTDGNALHVQEQNYEYDLLSPQKLLDKYVGKQVRLYQKNPYNEREEVVNATLLSNNSGPIFRIGDEITYGHPGRILFPGVPDSLIASPTLVWLLENKREKSQRVEASYLTGGIGWRADYVLTLDEKDRSAELGGWVTITNNSGAAYRDATIKLVAGDVNRVQEEMRYEVRRSAMPMAAPAPPPQFKEEGLFEYHVYTLQRPSTIKENQTKQINLLNADEIPVRKELVLAGAPYFFQSNYNNDVSKKQKVSVYVEMENREQNHLGMPLPKGIVRVYKRDSDKALQFVGEDAIDHTARNEKVRVKLGEAFDVVAERKQTDWKKRASDTYEAAYEIVVRNHKKEAVVVRVLEPVPGDWKLLSSSHESSKADSGALEYRLPVAADGETRLVYRVSMRY